jgi:hypothetical protein
MRTIKGVDYFVFDRSLKGNPFLLNPGPNWSRITHFDRTGPDSSGGFLEELNGKSPNCPGLPVRGYCAENNRRVQICSSGGSLFPLGFRIYGGLPRE